MKLLLRSGLVVAMTILPRLVFSQSSGNSARLPFDNKQLLENSSARLQGLRKVVEQVNVDELSLQYKEGHLIERNRDIALKGITFAETSIKEQLSHPDSLDAIVETVLRLKDVDSNASDLEVILSNPITSTEEHSFDVRMGWANRILDSRQELVKLVDNWETRVHLVLIHADTKLTLCEASKLQR